MNIVAFSAIYHIIVLFIPEIWRGDHYIVFSQCDFAKKQQEKNDDETKNDYRYNFHRGQLAETDNVVGHSPLEMV